MSSYYSRDTEIGACLDWWVEGAPGLCLEDVFRAGGVGGLYDAAKQTIREWVDVAAEHGDGTDCESYLDPDDVFDVCDLVNAAKRRLGVGAEK